MRLRKWTRAPWAARLAPVVLLLGLVPALSGCGYALAGRGAFLPEHIKVIGIPPFESAVPRQDVVEKLTSEVTKEFISRGSYTIVTGLEGADAALTGRITGFVTTPITFDDTGRATRSQLTITAGVVLRDLKDSSVIYDNPAYQFRTELELGTDETEFFDPESEAVEQIAREFARTLVSTIVEGF